MSGYPDAAAPRAARFTAAIESPFAFVGAVTEFNIDVGRKAEMFYQCKDENHAVVRLDGVVQRQR